MFARRLNVLTNGGVLATAAATAFVVGSACKSPDCFFCGDYNDSFSAVAWGANVIPAPPPADTSAKARVAFSSSTLAYSYSISTAPSGTIDSIAFYQVDAGQLLPASATAILCAGAAACAATSGTGTLVPPATNATIETSIRAYGTQIVFFTTTAQKAAGGAMRGTMYTNPL
jgi:hypothetical protein